ncbi:MAG: hypothetical protein ACK56W_18290 [Pirellula sp.]
MSNRERYEMRRRNRGPAVSFFAFQDIITSVVGIFVLITIIMMIELVSKKVEGQSNDKWVADTLSDSLKSLEDELADMRHRSEQLADQSRKVAGVQQFNVEEIRSDIEKRIQQVKEQTKRSTAVSEQIRKVAIPLEGELVQLNEKAVEADSKRDELKALLDKLQYLDSKLATLTTEEPLIFRNEGLAGKSLVIADIQDRQLSVLDLARDTRRVYSGSDRMSKFGDWVDGQDLGKIHFLLLVRPGAAKSFDAVQAKLEAENASFGFDVIASKRAIKLRSEVEK